MEKPRNVPRGLQTRKNPAKGGSAAKKKILVVEDHPDSREVLVFQLSNMGYDPLQAETGEEGLEKASAEAPDLIIMDLGLPGINGIEATVKLKQNPKTANIPVVALTAWQEQDYRSKALEAGMMEFLSKPTLIKSLKEVIEKFLQAKP